MERSSPSTLYQDESLTDLCLPQCSVSNFMGCISRVIESRCLQTATAAHRKPQGKALVARTGACGSFFISKPWLRRERKAPPVPCLLRALQEPSDFHRPSCISLTNLPLPSLYLKASVPPGSGCTAASGSGGSHLRELWEMLQKCGSCGASVPWPRTWCCRGMGTGLEQSFSFPKVTSQAQLMARASQGQQHLAAASDGHLVCIEHSRL